MDSLWHRCFHCFFFCNWSNLRKSKDYIKLEVNWITLCIKYYVEPTSQLELVCKMFITNWKQFIQSFRTYKSHQLTCDVWVSNQNSHNSAYYSSMKFLCDKKCRTPTHLRYMEDLADRWNICNSDNPYENLELARVGILTQTEISSKQ